MGVRSCVGCGGREDQPALVRMTFRDGVLLRDGSKRAAGRGGYLHRRDSCWAAFVGRRGPVRSLREAVPRATREAFVRELHADASGREG